MRIADPRNRSARHLPRPLAWLLALAVATPSLAAAQQFSDDAAGYGYVDDSAASLEGLTVVRIDVRGNVATTADQIRYWLSTREGQPFSERIIDGDYLRLVNTGLFEDIQFKRSVAGDGVRLLVVVKEKALIRRVEFRGNHRLKEKKLRKTISSAIGQRFDEGRAASDRRAIEALYQKEFFYFATTRISTEPFEDGLRLIFDIEEGGRVFVAAVRFRGNVAFTDRELQARMQTKPSGFLVRGRFDREEFERDLLRLKMFYQSRGYLDIDIVEQPFEVVSDRETNQWRRRDIYLHIDINEGQQYRFGSISFVGNDLVSDSELRAVMKSTPGQTYDAKLLDDDCRRIRDTYGLYPNSRFFTKVFPDPPFAELGPVADVTINVLEAPPAMLTSVRVTGLEHTKEHVVLRELELLPGEQVDSRKWNRSVNNIHRLGYFKEPGFGEPDFARLVEDGDNSRAAAVLDLREDRTGRISLMAGYSDRDGAMGSIGLSQRNFDFMDFPRNWKDLVTGQSFRGAGQDFSINVSKGTRRDAYTASFMNPWIFGKPISFGLSGWYTDERWDDFHEQRTGFGLTFGKRLFNIPQLRGSVGFKLENVNLTDFQYGVSQYWKMEEGSHRINRYTLNITYDDRNNLYVPTKGNYLSATYELAGKAAGGSEDFWRAFLEAQTFIPIYEDRYMRPWVIALRGEGALADHYGRSDHVPIYERHYAGGVGSVRGYQPRTISPKDMYSVNMDSIGGEGRITGSAELFVPVYRDMLRASAFYDVGTVWENMNDGPSDWRRSFGLGMHIKVPISPMPIMLYYSWIRGRQPGDDDERFQFSLGMLF